MRYVFGLAALVAAAGVAAYSAEVVSSNWRTLGDAPPELNVDFIKGDPITLESGVGKHVFVIEFWATWCGPCKITIPHLTKLQKTYGDRGLVVIGISNEDRATVTPHLEEMGEKMDYRVAIDRANTTNNRYFGGFGRLNAFPTAFIIDGNGRVAWIGTPGNPFMDELIDKLVRDLPRIAQERAAAGDGPPSPGE
jgi:thiol-disulfide isomerase/thioredoxin